MDDESDKISRLEDRIEQLEATTKKMMPTRRDALKFGGAAAIGAAAMSGTASAGSSQVGTIGDSNNLVDVEAEDIDVSDTINGASVSSAAAGEALTSDGAGGLTFASVGGGVPPNFSYVDRTSSRSFATNFTNNTGKALFVSVRGSKDGNGDRMVMEFVVNNQNIYDNDLEVNSGSILVDNMTFSVSGFVPNGATYRVNGFFCTVLDWFEAEM